MVRVYQCENCGGSAVYNPGTRETICPNCGKRENISSWNVDLENNRFSGKVGPESSDTAGTGTGTIKCPCCSGEISADVYTSATACPYCDSPVIIESQVQGMNKPSRIVPFGYDKKEAKKKVLDWAKKGPLTPKSFKSNTVLNKIKGVYAPFWLFSYDVNVEMEAVCENKTETVNGDEKVETTETYRVNRATSGHYEMVPYGVSNDIPAKELAIVEPYNYNEIQEFSMPFLSGYEAEKFARMESDLRPEVKKELEKDAADATEETITGYDSVDVKSVNVTFSHEKFEYVLMPVYTLDYSFGNKKYPIFLNGQTGKLAGERPSSKLKGLAFAGIALSIAMVICGLISFFLIHKMDLAATFGKWWVWLIIGVIAGLITLLVVKAKQSGFGRYSRRNYLDGKKVKVDSKRDILIDRQTKTTKINNGKEEK